MFFNRFYVKTMLILLFMGNCCAFVAAGNVDIWQYAYYPELGTLPTEQGWPFVEGNGSSPDPTVANGIMHQGPTSTTEYQAWVKDGSLCNFRGHVPFVMECKLKIISSNYVDYGYGWHPGWHLCASDKDKSYYALGVMQSGVRLTNTSSFPHDSRSSQFVALDTTLDFTVYRVVLFNGIGQLYVNGSPIVSLPIGSTNDHSPFLVFGDPSALPTSELDIEYIRFGIISEPADMNTNGIVDLDDFAAFAPGWYDSNCGRPDWCGGRDFDQSGTVDSQDLLRLADNWLTGYATVP